MKLENLKKLIVFVPYVIIVLSVLLVDLLLWKMAPGSWSCGMSYNSFYLQAKAWLTGHLSLPENYSWLEIATYDDKYYISFPPIPSVVLLPFAAVVGDLKGKLGNYITFIMVSLGAIYAYQIGIKIGISKINSILLTFILTIGSGFMFIMCNGAVWFMAQSFSFTFLIVSLYFSITDNLKHTKWALFFYALGVGCRPLNAIWIILIAILLWKNKNVGTPEDGVPYEEVKAEPFFKTLFEKFKIMDLLPAAIVALFLAGLNYARFGNPLEFGHNYLPEFDKTHEHFAGAQFGLEHLKGNLKSLFKWDGIVNGRLHFDRFNGILFIVPNPIYLIFAIGMVFGNLKPIKSIIMTVIIVAVTHVIFTAAIDILTINQNQDYRGLVYFIDVALFFLLFVFFLPKDKNGKDIIIITVLVTIIHIILTCMHRTMGGWHWGHRYLIDMTPGIFLATCYFLKDKKWFIYVLAPILVLGFIINFVGAIGVYGVTENLQTWYNSLPFGV